MADRIFKVMSDMIIVNSEITENVLMIYSHKIINQNIHFPCTEPKIIEN